MQFIPNGPDIPNALLQAHEEGRVVFFCGAGISYPVGLPGFKGLVETIYALIGTTRDGPDFRSELEKPLLTVGSLTPHSTCWSGACRAGVRLCAAS